MRCTPWLAGILALLPLRAEAQDTTLARLHLEVFPFGVQQVEDPVDILVDGTGHVWLLGGHRAYCLLDREVTPVADLQGSGTILGWDASSTSTLDVVRKGGRETILERLSGPYLAPDPRDRRRAALPDGRTARLSDQGSLLLDGPDGSEEVPLRFDRHGNLFTLRTDGNAALVFDPRNGLWVMGGNGVVLASHLPRAFQLKETPVPVGKVVQVVEDPALDRRFVYSRGQGLLVEELSSGRLVKHIERNPDGGRLGGTKWRNAEGMHLTHDDHCLYRYDAGQDELVKVLDLRQVLPPGKGDLRINDFEAGPGHRFAWLGVVDNLLVAHELATGRTRVIELLAPGSYSGINLMVETALWGDDRALVVAEHGQFLVNASTGRVRAVQEEWPALQFGPNFRGSGAHVIGDTLLVLPSFDSGIFLYNIRRDSLYRPQGAPDHLLITDIFWDGLHHVFGTCRSGLLVLDLRENSAHMLHAEHGLPLGNLYYRYISVGPGGKLFLGLTDRYARFSAADLVRSDLQGLAIDLLEVNGMRRMHPPYAGIGDALEQVPQSGSIGLRMGRVLRSTPPFTGAFVRLDGDPGSIVLHDDREVIRFHGLEPGDHVVEAAFSRNGPWSKVLDVHIAPPFWRTWWFITGVALALMLLTAVLVAWRSRVLREKALLQAEYDARITELELSSLRARMHPHFIFNSLNSIKSFIAANEPRTATRYLNKFAQLVRSILNNSGKAEVELRSELKGLELYLELERMRFDGSFDLDLHVDPAIDPDRVLVPPLIVQPYAENAIWHGLMHKDGDRELSIGVSRENWTLHITVRDNGIGREASRALNAMSARKHRSLGMSITEEVIARSGAGAGVEVKDLHAPDGSPAGTEVHIRIPYRTA